jgi:hypothetical protein
MGLGGDLFFSVDLFGYSTMFCISWVRLRGERGVRRATYLGGWVGFCHDIPGNQRKQSV